MSNFLILPLGKHSYHASCPQADEACSAQVLAWLEQRINLIHEAGRQPLANQSTCWQIQPAALADVIASVLTHRVFNFQSRERVEPLMASVRQNLLEQIGSGQPIALFLLYNGGYRASPFPDDATLIFEPDQTELMLLYQVALLSQKVQALYAPGIDFSIVVNNGVAHWVNDIPLVLTEKYARQLRHMIAALGASRFVRVLLQSELAGYEPLRTWAPVCAQASWSDQAHQLVERFLGRRCSQAEAQQRTALYTLAETQWAQDLAPVAAKKKALVMRQVAHPEMLSFRPFPGGAIRIQNGSLGFQVTDGHLAPKLITTESMEACGAQWVPFNFAGTQAVQGVPAEALSDA